jgi:hypothetical protein
MIRIVKSSVPNTPMIGPKGRHFESTRSGGERSRCALYKVVLRLAKGEDANGICAL